MGANLSKHLSRLQQLRPRMGFAKTVHEDILDLDHNLLNGTSTSWLQEYRSRFSLQTFLSDCFEGQIITCVVVVIFVAVFLLREWIVQNIPMEAPIIGDDDVAEMAIDQDEREPMNQQQQQPADNLFDNHWNHHQHEPQDFDQRPPSPVAPAWFESGESSSTNPIFFNDENFNRPARATSMPPSLTTASSFHEEYQTNAKEQLENRRSASMEPFIDTTPSDHLNSSGHDMSSGFARGHPPNAPRLRHAEAPTLARPVLEVLEEEEDAQQEPPRAAAHFIAQPLQPPPPPQPQPGMDDAEDDDDNIEEFEGVLEAIGMQGSFWSLLQNCALMGLLIALSLGAAVWIPYLIGMLFIMTEILDLIRIPLKLTRLITDPVVDFLFYVCIDHIGPWILDTYYQYWHPYWVEFTSWHISQKIHIALVYIRDRVLSLANSSKTDIATSLISSSSTVIPTSTAAAAAAATTTTTFEPSSALVMSMAKFINKTEPILESAFHRYQLLATGQTAMDRFACIFVGYIIISIASCWYLSRSPSNGNNNSNMAALGRTAQEAIRHQGIIFKVGMFITIELALFPIVCGFLLDFSTMPLFKSASFIGRLLYLKSHPVPSVFLHWFLGTGFMFLFAVLVTLCRDVVRPGVMWFIRDPNDPQFHPIREIVERPVFFQFKKIGASALIYLTVIVVGVGGVVHFLDTVAGHILPLRWNLSVPLSVVPMDLIVIHVGIPAIVNYVKPKQTIKRLFVRWITLTCRYLRLSSFVFGGRKADEEGTLVYHSWMAWLKRTKPTHYPVDGAIDDIIGSQVSYLWEGQLLRVPRHDSVPIIERRRMLVPVDNFTLEPLDETERRLGHPASSAPGGDEVNTVIVYSPPHFKERLLVFVGFMWLSVSVFLCAITVLPVLLGRYIFEHKLHLDTEVHDIYSFVLGGCILLLMGTLVQQCYKSIKDISSQSTWSGLTLSVRDHSKQWVLWLYRWTFFVVSFGVLLPMSLGIMIELYLVLPFVKISPDAPSIEVISMWAAGFVCQVIVHGFVQVIPNNMAKEILDDASIVSAKLKYTH
ncbi:hypothetical protein [Parasitella parasitica]|uniref:RING-type E3 ubiquitin transferase n=1 Tax=Parasitella parasitica TaxID=35722 RepID=A0A0B7NLD5_9FUNG|nr:hypothetical protein [Parasitella parasitica]